MNLEFKKRIITSLILFSLLILMYLYSYILLISLIIIAVISWIEFYGLISKIFKKEDKTSKILRFICKAASLFYLTILIYLIISTSVISAQYKILIIYPILISIMSDIGGLVIGKIFKGKKLAKISPKKTISGSIGSFIFSIFLIPFFINHLPEQNLSSLLLITMFISLISQLGDLFISFLKRKAKVKNTSDILPGHGGFLDRVDGIIFAIPLGIMLLNTF